MSEVAVWAPQTRVSAGTGAAARAGAVVAAYGRRALLVGDRDEALADPRMSCVLSGVRSDVFAAVEADPPLELVAEVCERIAASRAQVVVAVGGGSVMDVAKTAALACRNPGLLARAGRRGGYATLPEGDERRPPLPTVMLPTTLGTGAEVNSVSCLRADGGKRLLIDAALAPTAALIDPVLTRTLPRRLCLQGAFETFVRLLVPFVTDPKERPVQDAVALGLMRCVVEHGDAIARGRGDDEDRLALSLAAVASHVAWANTGRPVGGHLLWYLGNPVSPAWGVDKMTGLAAVAPAYLEAVALGAHASLGSSQRLAVAMDAIQDSVTTLMLRWELPRSLSELAGEPPRAAWLADAATELWGEPELLGVVPREVLEDIYRAAFAAPEEDHVCAR